jgi:hypothetical protein
MAISMRSEAGKQAHIGRHGEEVTHGMSEKGSDGMSLEELLGRRVDRRTVLRGAALASLSAPALARRLATHS